ncbi:MAG TPA: alpha-L-rhamnosidase N-terminal domain-containing protein, partial [Draconibacterium sp.]|nr:alpha-L-rhamnosidase N-terminal domain-containing protein [Draconibacterium sp.]
MKHKKLFLIVFFISTIPFFAFAKTQVVNLVTEYLVNPIGIDVQKPRLSWQILSDEQNIMQSAYEIRVTDSPENLTKKNRLIWTSGKVTGDNSVNVEYEGPELQSMQRVYWQVRIWDSNNKVSDWSKPAFWEMGILNPGLWKASWISKANEPETAESKPAHYYRKEFPVKKRVKSARVYVTSKGLYQLFLNGEKVSDDLFTPGWTTYNKRLQYQIYDVTPMLKD